jgi:hypothetical protein
MPQTNNNTSSMVDAILAEFNSLKEEIRSRSNDQSTILSLNVTVIGAIGGLYLSEHADPRILFLIPIISSLLGIRYIDHAINIDNLGRFIQREVKPQLASALGVGKVVDYEVFAESFAERSQLRYLLLALPVALLFGGVLGCALVLPFIGVETEQYDTSFVGGAVLGGVLLALFNLFWYRVVKRAKRAQPGQAANKENPAPSPSGA